MAYSARKKKILRPVLVDPVLHRAAAFHATSVQEYRDIRAQGLHQPVAILPNGIDVPAKPDRKRKPGRRQVLFLGRIHSIKGIDNLLQAWARLQNDFAEWELVITGPDDYGYLQDLKKLFARLGVMRCQFTGPKYGDAKLQAYVQADLYVLPTRSENFGMTVAEALAAGTPHHHEGCSLGRTGA